ncbi:unnamed protein product [Penicillium palitans]
MSSGGLVSALGGLCKFTTFQWYAWPGLEVPGPEIPVVKQRWKDEYGAVPVLIDDDLTDCHYNGFSNSVLWPLFPYRPGEMTFEESAWEACKKANRLFAKAISDEVRDDDLIWVHDYNLKLLPKMLRKKLASSMQSVKFGFFLHTPFPSSEIYRIFPVCNEILLGVSHCACPHVAQPAGQNGKRKIFSLGWMPIGTCRGKPSPPHIMNNIRWIEALSLYEGKSTIFCGSSVALAPKFPDVQANKSDQATCGAR